MEPNTEVSSYLVVNRVEVLDHAGCSACGRGFSTNPMGEKALVLPSGTPSGPTFFARPAAITSSAGSNRKRPANATYGTGRYRSETATGLHEEGQAAASEGEPPGLRPAHRLTRCCRGWSTGVRRPVFCSVRATSCRLRDASSARAGSTCRIATVKAFCSLRRWPTRRCRQG